MALDRQKILGELGSVMKQLQNADCGCLGKLFGNPQQAAAPTMGAPLPTCGGCRRACCHGHGMNQPAPNINYNMPSEASNYHQPMAGNMYGYGPQIVNMMKGDHTKSQHMSGYSQPQGLTGPMVIDAPQSPHGKIGLTPFTSPSMSQPGYLNPNMNHGEVSGQMQNQFIPPSNNNTENISTSRQIPSAPMNPWPQPAMAAHPAAHHTSIPHSNVHGQHSEGIAKFNQMFPGVQQGMGGNLGFDPMAIAIQMNPANHVQSAMDTMNKLMSGNKGMDQMLNIPASLQPGVSGQPVTPANTMNQNPPPGYATTQQASVAGGVTQGNINQVPTQQLTGQNVVPNQGLPNQPQTHVPNQVPANQLNANVSNQVSQNQPNTYVPNQVPPNQPTSIVPNQGSPNQQNANANLYGQPIPPQNQQVYAAAVDPNVANQARSEGNQQSADQHQYAQQQQMMDMNTVPNLPVIQNETTAQDYQLETLPEDPGYPNQASARQMIKEPIFPVDTSKNLVYIPPKQDRNYNNNYGYNTLGQPVEMLPAKMYHPPEPGLPQTLSPQPVPVKPRSSLMRMANVKATVSKTSLMGNKRVGKTPSRAQLQQVYNQYKGSQSFTQQNVRRPDEGTYSDGRLNVPQATKPLPVPVERVGGDTVVNNPPSNLGQVHKVEQVMGQIGDVPATKPAGDSLPLKESPVPIRKCRNGLQDVAFSTYATSAAWSFHGHGRTESPPTRHFRHRQF